jgi:hypothetical protein
MRSIAGRNVQAWDYKQKKNLVIVFLHAGCASCADFFDRLASQASDLKEREAVALIVYLETLPMALVEPLPPEIVVGADISGRSLRAYSGEEAAGSGGLDTLGVFVTDRYGDLYAQWVVRRDHQFPGIVEILGRLGQIEIACEECGVCHWPAEV